MSLQHKRDTPARRADLEKRANLVLAFAEVLHVNGQSTDQTLAGVEVLASKLGLRSDADVRWGQLRFQLSDGSQTVTVESLASPTDIDMTRVAATMAAIETFDSRRASIAETAATLRSISVIPPASTAHFAIAAGVAAAMLAVIFGIEHVVPAALIFVSAAAGALLRRTLARFTGNLFVQPLCAALLAGIVGAIAAHLQLSSSLLLVAVCPCMILVPGPHILNAASDLIQGRIQMGAARATYATLVVVSVTIGLLLGLTVGGTQLPVYPPGRSVPLLFDVIAAGIAVAVYSTFFSAPVRTLPAPIAVGMLAHAARWVAITLFSASSATGAFVACAIVGFILTPVARRTRVPFAAIGFASVVSMIPGVFLFRTGSGLDQLAHGHATLALIAGTISDAMTAATIILAMSLGLIVPKLLVDYAIDRFRNRTPAVAG